MSMPHIIYIFDTITLSGTDGQPEPEIYPPPCMASRPGTDREPIGLSTQQRANTQHIEICR